MTAPVDPPVPHLPVNTVLRALLFVVLSSFILYFGRSVLIPISFAVLISCIIYPVCRWLENKGWNRTLAIFVSMSILILSLTAILGVLVWQLGNFNTDWPRLQDKVQQLTVDLSGFLSVHFNLSLEQQAMWWENIKTGSGEQIIPAIKTTLGSLGVFLVMLVLVPIMSGLILYQRKAIFFAIHYFTPSISRESLRDILLETINTYYQFIQGMMRVYFVVGLLNSLGLLILGVPHAFLFGFIASILTFIPYVGIIIGASFPMAVSWLTFDSAWYPAAVVLIFAFVQYLEANVIFPWAVSSKLNINTLATIIAILVGGLLWGSAGMILFVPFLGIVKLFSDRMKEMETLSLFLGAESTKKKKPIKPG